MKTLRRLAVVGLTLILSACATTSRIDAGADVHAFLTAIRDNDRATFDRHVDRAALQRQIEARMLAETRNMNLNTGGQMVAALLAQPLAGLAGEVLIQPRVFRSAAVSFGYSPDKPIPGRLALAGALRYTGSDRVCAAKSSSAPCLLTFVREDGVWRLTEFGGDIADLRRELGR